MSKHWEGQIACAVVGFIALFVYSRFDLALTILVFVGVYAFWGFVTLTIWLLLRLGSSEAANSDAKPDPDR